MRRGHVNLQAKSEQLFPIASNHPRAPEETAPDEIAHKDDVQQHQTRANTPIPSHLQVTRYAKARHTKPVASTPRNPGTMNGRCDLPELRSVLVLLDTLDTVAVILVGLVLCGMVLGFRHGAIPETTQRKKIGKTTVRRRKEL